MKKNKNEGYGEIVIYKPKKNHVQIEVNLKNESIWITQAQMSKLFKTERSVITKHIRNILKTKELTEKAVCAIFAHTAADGKKYETKFYNLDMIISVGYRVNSKQGTLFRIWATDVLKKHLIEGYTFNKQRLATQTSKLNELEKAIRLFESITKTGKISDDAKGLIQVLSDYTKALGLLDEYDHQNLQIAKTNKKEKFKITYEDAQKVIAAIKKKFKGTDLVGKEKDASFRSSIGAIYQTFKGKDLYPSIEEKAAHLLYFVTKDHSFVDGNKRISAALFVWFLQKNGILFTKKGEIKISNNALVALILMIAQSDPKEKETMIKIIVNLLAV